MTATHSWTVCLLVLVLSLAITPAVQAHDIGAMNISCTFNGDGTYSIAVILDHGHLPPGYSIDTVNGGLARQFAEGTIVAFDNNRIDVPADSIAVSTLSLVKTALSVRGSVPQGASTFTFTNNLPLGQCYFQARRQGDAEPVAQWLNVGQVSEPFLLQGPTLSAASRGEVIATYLKLGFTHIVPKGLDHILFVLGLFLLSFKWKPLLAQVTAFTVAHSITLALSIYGVVNLPPRIVEPMIALSIAYVAIENLFLREFKPWRTAIVFCFGLIHGLGFAGVLTELGLPRSQFVPALIAFNCGVELGQLAVITTAFLAVGVWFHQKPWYRTRITMPASAVIALIGVYWTVERIAM